MKWLIIRSVNEPEIDESVFAFFREKNVDIVEHAISVESGKSILDDDRSILLGELIGEVTHCIAFYSSDLRAYSPLSYVMGFFSGAGIPVFTVGYTGSTPYYATKLYSFERFDYYLKQEEEKIARKKLIEKGIPFTPDEFSFHISKADEEICTLFLKSGIDLNCSNSAGTPMLSIASRNDKEAMVSWLLENGAHLNALSTDRGYTPVMDAVWRSNANMVDIFVTAGADLSIISSDGQPILVLAVGTGNSKVCELLVKNGADPYIKDHLGVSAYEYATLFKHDEILAIFDENKK